MKHIFKKNQIIITALAIMIAVAGYLNYSGNKLGKDATQSALEQDGYVSQSTNDKKEGESNAANDSALVDLPSPEQGMEDVASNDVSADLSLSDTSSTDSASSDLSLSDDSLNDEASAELSSSDDSLSDSASADPAAGNETAEGEIENPGEAVLTSSPSNAGFAAEAKLSREQVRAKNKETLLDVINNDSVSQEQKQNAIDSMSDMTDIAEKEASAELMLEAKGFKNSVVSITDGSVDVVIGLSEISDAQRAQIEDIVKRKTEISGENIVITPMSK